MTWAASRKSPKELNLGTFEVESGRLMISDPCYHKGTWCQGELKNVRNGSWNATVVETNEGEWGVRCAELIATHVNAPNIGRIWAKQDIDVGVDSGQAGIFDSEHYRLNDDENDYEYQGDKLTPNDPWYCMCCDRTLNSPGAGVIPFGVVSSSGFGDGSYRCFVREENDEIVAVKIIFITGEEDEEL